LVFEKTPILFCRKLAKIAETCDHNIDPSKTFWHKKLSKKSTGLHPRQGYLLQRSIFTGLNKTSQLKKITLFQHASSSTKLSMPGTISFLFPTEK
jgi:hypothetical protein